MSDSITYSVRFSNPRTHYIEVEARFPSVPNSSQGPLELMMATWTPGSYLIREFARHVEGLRASNQDGTSIGITKVTKNRWNLDIEPGESIWIEYRLYCHEMSVRTNWVDVDFALLNGASTFITRTDALNQPHRVRIERPREWRETYTALPVEKGEKEVFVASDFDHLVDSPILIGNPTVYDFDLDGVPHKLINEGESGIWDGPQSAGDTERIARQLSTLWDSIPYDQFLIFNLLTGGRGGLEHCNSTVLMADPWKTRTRKSYLEWLGLVSHELFHAWNGKRLRPAALGPFGYESEAYTRELWAVEGLTAYYDDLVVHRAGLSTQEEYLTALSKSLEKLQTTPGRELQTVEEASFDAWIKLYRPDENSVNSAISYYTKGAVFAWLLYMKIRRSTAGKKSLDYVMRLAFERFSGEEGFHPGDWRKLAEEVAECDLQAFFEDGLRSTQELDYASALSWLGLQLQPSETKTDGDPPPAWLGLATEAKRRFRVSEIKRGTPAAKAGLEVGDELLAIDGFRVTADNWKERLQGYAAGDRAEILVARRQKLRSLEVEFAEPPTRNWKLGLDPEADEQQTVRLAAWLGSQSG